MTWQGSLRMLIIPALLFVVFGEDPQLPLPGLRGTHRQAKTIPGSPAQRPDQPHASPVAESLTATGDAKLSMAGSCCPRPSLR